jgi:hypothetical protein
MTATQRAAAGCSIAVLAAGLVYLNALDNPFVYDDARTIVGNRSLVGPWNLRAVLLQNVSRPLVNVTYFVDRALWGPAPFGFHVTNVLLHMLNVALLFLFTRGLIADRLGAADDEGQARRAVLAAFAAAALFAVHPMMTEAVGYISGRSDLLSGTCMLLAFLAVRRWMNTDHARWLAAAMGAAFLALGAKETAVVLPVLLVCYVLFVRQDPVHRRRRYLVMLCAPLIAVAVIAASVRLGLFVFVEYAGRVGWQWRYGLTELDVFTRYIALMIAPVSQTIFHAIPATTSFADPRAIVAIGTSLGCAALIVISARRRSIVGFGLTWFVLMLVPSALLVMLDRGEPMAERRVYFASAGLFLAAGHLAGAIRELLARRRPIVRRAVAIAGALVLVSLAGRTVVRNLVWSSPILLWAEAAERAPDHWLPALVLGEELHEAGRHPEAMAAFRKALRTGAHVPAIYENLGVCLLELRRLDDARQTYTALSEVAPRSAAGLNGLATIDLVQGNAEAARRGFLAALDVEPRSIEARRGLVILAERPGGDSAEAFRRCEEIELLAPGSPGIRECLQKHRPDETP